MTACVFAEPPGYNYNAPQGGANFDSAGVGGFGGGSGASAGSSAASQLVVGIPIRKFFFNLIRLQAQER